jgi:hypothetical protein
MDDIGHLEFGQLHRPLQFAGMDDVRARYQPDTLDYWVAYWELAFTHVLRYRPSIVLISYEMLCANGQAAMPALADRLGLSADALTIALGDQMRAPRDHSPDTSVTDRELLRRSRELHHEMLQASVGALYDARARADVPGDVVEDRP